MKIERIKCLNNLIIELLELLPLAQQHNPLLNQKKNNNNAKNNKINNNNNNKNNINNNKINNINNNKNNINNNKINNYKIDDDLIINLLIGNYKNKPVVKNEIKYNHDLNYNKNLISPKAPINNRDIYDNPYRKQLRLNFDNLFDNNNSLNKKNIFNNNGNNDDILDGTDDIIDGPNDIFGNIKKKFNDLDTNLDKIFNIQKVMDGYNIPGNQDEEIILNHDENGDGYLDQNEYDQISQYEFEFMQIY